MDGSYDTLLLWNSLCMLEILPHFVILRCYGFSDQNLSSSVSILLVVLSLH